MFFSPGPQKHSLFLTQSFSLYLISFLSVLGIAQWWIRVLQPGLLSFIYTTRSALHVHILCVQHIGNRRESYILTQWRHLEVLDSLSSCWITRRTLLSHRGNTRYCNSLIRHGHKINDVLPIKSDFDINIIVLIKKYKKTSYIFLKRKRERSKFTLKFYFK